MLEADTTSGIWNSTNPFTQDGYWQNLMRSCIRLSQLSTNLYMCLRLNKTVITQAGDGRSNVLSVAQLCLLTFTAGLVWLCFVSFNLYRTVTVCLLKGSHSGGLLYGLLRQTQGKNMFCFEYCVFCSAYLSCYYLYHEPNHTAHVWMFMYKHFMQDFRVIRDFLKILFAVLL